MSLWAAMVWVAAASGDPALAAGRAAGTVAVGDQAFPLAWAYARPDGHERIEVVVADRELPEDRLDGEIPLERAAYIAQATFVRFYFVSGRATSWAVSSPRGGGGGGDSWDADLQFTPDGGAEVGGRLSGRAPDDHLRTNVTLSGRFRARHVAVVLKPAKTAAEREARALLKSKGYDLRSRDFFQASFADPDLLPTFLRAGQPADTRFPETDETLLMNILARDEGNCDTDADLAMIRALLSGGADANELDVRWGLLQGTPLTRAYPCAGEMTLLLDAGARLGDLIGDPKAKVTVGMSILKDAIEDDDAEVVGLLLSRGLDVRPNGADLLKAAAGKPEITGLLRRAGARPAGPRGTSRPAPRPASRP